MTCLSAYMYRQISKCTDKTPKKHYWGGGGNFPPPPAPSGYANVAFDHVVFTMSLMMWIFFWGGGLKHSFMVEKEKGHQTPCVCYMKKKHYLEINVDLIRSYYIFASILILIITCIYRTEY